MAAPRGSAGALVVIDYLDVVGVAVAPHEAHPPLVVDADRVLARPVPLQGLQTGRRRRHRWAEVG